MRLINLVFVCAVILCAYANTTGPVVSETVAAPVSPWERLFNGDFTKVKAQVDDLFENGKNKVQTALNEVKTYLETPGNKKILDDVLVRVEKVRGKSETFAKEMMSYLGETYKNITEELAPHKIKMEKYVALSKDKAQKIREQMMRYTEEARDMADKARKQAVETMNEFQEYAKTVQGKLPYTMEEFKEQLKELRDVTEKQFEELRQRSEQLKTKANDALEDVQEKVLEMTKQQLEVAKEHLKTAKDQAKILREWIMKMWEEAQDKAKEVSSKTQEHFENVRGKFDDVRGKFDDVRGKFDEHVAKLQGKAEDMTKKGKEYFETAKDYAEEAHQKTLEHWEEATDRATVLYQQAMEQLRAMNMSSVNPDIFNLREMAENNVKVARQHLDKIRTKLNEYMEKMYEHEYTQQAKDVYGKLNTHAQSAKETAQGHWRKIQDWIKNKDAAEQEIEPKLVRKFLSKAMVKKHISKLRRQRLIDTN